MRVIATYAAVSTVVVLLLIYRVAEGREAWDAFEDAVRAWPREILANLVDYFWTRPSNRMELRGEQWISDRVAATMAAHWRLMEIEGEPARLAAERGAQEARARMNKRASDAYAVRGRKVLQMRAGR